jgi:hypothetical protein
VEKTSPNRNQGFGWLGIKFAAVKGRSKVEYYKVQG